MADLICAVCIHDETEEHEAATIIGGMAVCADHLDAADWTGLHAWQDATHEEEVQP